MRTFNDFCEGRDAPQIYAIERWDGRRLTNEDPPRWSEYEGDEKTYTKDWADDVKNKLVKNFPELSGKLSIVKV